MKKVGMDTFGEWLRYQRNQLRLTRKQLADRVGYSVAMLRKIEDCERRPSVQIAELMARELGIPLPERSIFVKVARGDLGVDWLSSIVITAPRSKTRRINLPAQLAPIVGRQREISELCLLLRNPNCRLLSLVGMGGIGKTRLAIEAAAHGQDAFADGVYFVPLASIHDARLIVPVIAGVMGYQFQSPSHSDPKNQLFSYLQEKHALLLLDNLEQMLADPGIKVLADLLSKAPHVKLMITSRESLELQGEWVFEVHGLPVPGSIYTEGSARDTSMEMFLQRARQVHQVFNTTAEDYPAVARICRLVEGMPLAIELAAAWVRVLSCAEIAQEIERGMDILSVSVRDQSPRHRSIRAVLEQSWELLTAEEKRILVRLSVFRGGFQRGGAEQVAGATLSILSSLISKSWVRRSTAGRYELHELVRQFTAERLAEHPEEHTAAQDSHGRYYVSLFGQANGLLRSSVQHETLAELTSEMDNFRAGWDWSVSQADFALIGQSTLTFATLYDMHGWLQEGCDVLGRTISSLETTFGQFPPRRMEQVALGRLLTAHSLLASRSGRYDQAREMLERSLGILRPLDEPGLLVESVTFLGMVMESIGSYSRAVELYTEGQEIAWEIGDRWFAALCFTCLTGLSIFIQRTVEPETTYQQFQSVVAEWRLIGDPRMTAIALNNLSLNAKMLGCYDEASDALEESVALSLSVGDRWGLGFAYRGLGLIAQAKGQHLDAVDKFRKSMDILTDLGARHDSARVLAEMGWSVFALGNESEAGRVWHESLSIAIETHVMFIALEALVGLACLSAKQGDWEVAFQMLVVVLDHPAAIQDTRDHAARLRSECETQLASQQVESALVQAHSKTFEAFVDEVLTSPRHFSSNQSASFKPCSPG